MDEEGMVYSLDDGARTVYFCDRFRRYKFVGEAGALALLQGMCTKNDTNLEANASLFSKVRSTPCACLTQRQQFLAAREIGVRV